MTASAIAWSSANVTPPSSATVSIAVSPSAIVDGETVTVKTAGVSRGAAAPGELRFTHTV